jgi:glutathione S-transferase
LRAWLVLKAFDIEFNEHLIQFDDFAIDGAFKRQIRAIHPTATVPVLRHHDLIIPDSLAISEYLAELFPELALWPKQQQQRARARAICAEMHSGFSSLRQLCPMNIEADLRDVGQQLWQTHRGLRENINRIQNIWMERPDAQGFLCGSTFSIADAFYAPVIMRMISYGLAIAPENQSYVERMLNLTALSNWINAARQEHCFIAQDEPYRDSN